MDLSSLVRHLKRIRGMFPEPLPSGPMEFDQWCADIFDIYGLPDHADFRHALASMILHQNSNVDAMPKRFFVKSIKKAMANQVAFKKLEEYRDQDKKKLAEQPKPEATTPVVASDPV